MSTQPGENPRMERALVTHFNRAIAGETARQRVRELRSEAHAFAKALKARPLIFCGVRGLDLAGDEGDGPLWLVAATLGALRETADEEAGRRGLPTLPMTLHVGEDYKHLASGLRAVHEPFLWGLLRKGDRLGHASALGLDVETWVAEHDEITMTLGVRVLDVAWMLNVLLDRSALPLPEVSGQEIDLLREELAGYGVDAAEAQAIQRGFGNAELLDTLLRGTRPGSFAKMISEWLVSRRGDRPTFNAPVILRGAGDKEVLKAIKRVLVADLAARQTVIEINPSSNLFIGGLDHLLGQEIFKIHPLQPGEGEAFHARSLPVCVSADDPLTFATSLGDELAYAWAGMVVGGDATPSVARLWLEETAEASMRGRFTGRAMS